MKRWLIEPLAFDECLGRGNPGRAIGHEPSLSRDLVRDEVARTIDDPPEVEDEIAALFSALGP